jgi:hypothetical protein
VTDGPSSAAPPDEPPVDRLGQPVDDRPLLPDVTADERDVGWGDPYERDDDERYLREVPPHHGT